jgi:hypothetical protein
MNATRIILLSLLCMLNMLCMHQTARSQCDEAQAGSVTIFLFDFKSPDIPQDKLHKFLDILTFKLNNGIRETLRTRGLLGKTNFVVKWCSGYPVTEQNSAVNNGKKLNSSGVMWGFIDQSTGQLKSSTKLTTLTDKPLTDLSNIVFERDAKELVDDSYIAFGAYILGKVYFHKRDMTMARKSFLYARELKSLPDLLARDLTDTLNAIDQNSAANKLAPIAKRGK